MKRAVKATGLFLALLIILLPLDIVGMSESSVPGNLLSQTVDFSVLPVSEEEFYDKKCALDTDSLLFTSGVMLDEPSRVGIGEDKTNFKGFYTRDTDGDGRTDTLCAASYNNKGMRFTLGMTVESDWSSAEAVVLHVDNSVNSWSVWQECILELNTVGGKNITMKPADEAADSVCFFVNENDLSINTLRIAETGYSIIPGNQKGWLIIPASVFSEEITENIASIGFDLSSKAGIYTSLSEIGFTADYEAFLGELTGNIQHMIELSPCTGGTALLTVDGIQSGMAAEGQTVKVEVSPNIGYELGCVTVTSADGKQTVDVNGVLFEMPDYDVVVTVVFDKQTGFDFPERIYGKATDLSGLTAGDYRDGDPNWDCVIDTGTEIYSKGIIIDREPMGYGENTVNFHGFWAIDVDGDGKTDLLKAHPFNDQGMNFTLGFNTAERIPDTREAIAIRIANTEITGSSWNETTLQSMMLTLIDSEGNEYPLKDPASAGDAEVYFVSELEQIKQTFKVSENGYQFIPATKSGWAVIPMELFEGISGKEELSAVSVKLSSTWNAYTYIYQVGFTSDIDELLNIMTGKAARYSIETEKSKNGSVTADSVSSREGRLITVTAVPDSGYVFAGLSVTEKESGNQVECNYNTFVMPACDVVISAVFKESPYSEAHRLNEVYTITQDFSSAEEAEYVDWENGPDLSGLIEQGILVEDLNRGFEGSGVENCFNGNGIYITDTGEGFGKCLRLWSHDNTGMSVSIKSNDITDTADYEGLVLHMHNTEHRSTAIPALSVTLYLKGDDGKPDLSNPIKPKGASALWGTTVYLIDDETGEVTEKQLGYSAEDASKLTETEKHYSQFFMPDAFTGYAVIPFSYFSEQFDAHDVAAVRLDYTVTDWYMYSNIYDIGFTPSTENFVRISSLGNYTEVLLYDELYEIGEDVFTKYYDTENTVTINVLKDYLSYYSWFFEGQDIIRRISLNPEIEFTNVSNTEFEKLKSSGMDAVYVNIRQLVLPGKASVSLDVSWDFFDDTSVTLYKFDPQTENLTDTGIKGTVANGIITLPFTEGGHYVVAAPASGGAAEEEQQPEVNPGEPVYDTITNTYEVEEKSGHYETIPGTQRYKTVRTTHFDGFKTWFIVLLAAGGVVVAAGITVTVIILVKRKKGGRL